MNTMHRERRSHARTFIEVTPELRRALEALVEAGIAALDEIDAPAEDLEDGGDDEPETEDSTLTRPTTFGGMASHMDYSTDEPLRLREQFDPRLALRPEASPDHDAWCMAPWPKFPWDDPNRREFDLRAEKRRIGGELVRIYWGKR